MENEQAGLTFYCPFCGELIEHDYTEEDLKKSEYLQLTCKCGFIENIATRDILKKNDN